MISDIQNGEIGSSVRGKLNAVIGAINAIPNQLDEKLDLSSFEWANLQNKPLTFPSDSGNGSGWNSSNAIQTSRQSSTAFVAIPGLSFVIPEGVPTFYEVQFYVFLEGTAGSAGAKWSTNFPIGQGVVTLQSSQSPAPTNLALNAASGAFPTAANMPSSLVVIGSAKFLSLDDGIFTLNFGQNTSSPNPITVLPVSRIEWRKLGS